MELWQYIDANYNAIIDCFVFWFFVTTPLTVYLWRLTTKLENKLKEKDRLIAEMDEFIQNNSKAWH